MAGQRGQRVRKVGEHQTHDMRVFEALAMLQYVSTGARQVPSRYRAWQ
jgi:hypothetical protein